VLLPAALAAIFAQADVNRRRYGFAQTLRLVGLLALSGAVLSLGEGGGLSQLPLGTKTVEHLYQLAGFALAALMLTIGIRRRWTETVNLGAALVGVLLLLRFVDWWWDVIPKYLFFLIVGLTAIAMMIVLRRLRHIAGARV
jgi:MFS superfamily sulfate permease-like transporter